MGFNSVFKGLTILLGFFKHKFAATGSVCVLEYKGSC